MTINNKKTRTLFIVIGLVLSQQAIGNIHKNFSGDTAQLKQASEDYRQYQKDFNIYASQDNARTRNKTEQGTISIAQTV